MGRVLYLGLLLLAVVSFLGLGGAASAEGYNHIIIVYAAVPQQRGVYIDKSGNIVKVAGNTSQNITPQVYDLNNNPLDMTPAVQRQYDDFLKTHGGHLDAGRTYVITPVITVNSQPTSQTIQVGSAKQSALQLSVKL